MRSVPLNPAPAIQFGSNVSAQRTAIVAGGVAGALVGGSIWAATYKHLGWVGAAFPLVGAVGGTLLWAGLGVQAAR